MPTSFAGAHIQGEAFGATRLKMRSHERNVTHTSNASQAQKMTLLLKNLALAAAYRIC
jgi:hypothetical protein